MKKLRGQPERTTHADTRQDASAPNRLPALSEAVGPSVRGFMLCIAAARVQARPDHLPPPRPSLVCEVVMSSSRAVPKSREHRGDGDTNVKHLVQTNGLAHRRLDVKRLDVLPVLLEQRHEEVDACARDIS